MIFRFVRLSYTGKRPWEKTCGFSLNCESFPANYGLVDQQCKSTELLQWNFTANSYFPLKTGKFPPRMFSHIRYITVQWVEGILATVILSATHTIY